MFSQRFLIFFSAYAKVTPNSGQLMQGSNLRSKQNKCNNRKKGSRVLKTNLIVAEGKNLKMYKALLSGIMYLRVFIMSLAVLYLAGF